MRKCTSLLTVAVRSSIYKILLILAAMASAMLGDFYYTYTRYDYAPNMGVPLESQFLGGGFGVTWTLESLIDRSHVHLPFLAAFCLISLVLLWAEGERKGVRTAYFYERLTVGERSRVAMLTLYNAACIMLLMAAAIAAALGMGVIFVYMVPPEYESVQMYFMAFYKSDFLHCLFPMADVIKWVRNVIVFAAWALTISVTACRRMKPWGVYLWMMLIVLGLVQQIGGYQFMDITLILAGVISIGIDIGRVWFVSAEEEW